jgi:hypothetical protein
MTLLKTSLAGRLQLKPITRPLVPPFYNASCACLVAYPMTTLLSFPTGEDGWIMNLVVV